MKIQAGAPVKSVQIEAVIIRADGRVEPVGTLAYWHRNPLKRAWFWLKRVFQTGIFGK